MNASTPPGDRRPEHADRRPLGRAPAERYRREESTAARPPSAARAVGLAALIALAGAVTIAVVGGAMSVSAGLIVVSGVIGWAIGRVLTGSGATMPVGRRAILSAALAIGSVALGHVGVWLVATSQGGALGLLDYLGQTRGPLVPLALVVGAVIGWWSAR